MHSMSGVSKESSGCSTPPMGVATEAMDEGAHRLCWPLDGSHVPYLSQCIFQIDGGTL